MSNEKVFFLFFCFFVFFCCLLLHFCHARVTNLHINVLIVTLLPGSDGLDIFLNFGHFHNLYLLMTIFGSRTARGSVTVLVIVRLLRLRLVSLLSPLKVPL